jgi:hypothetical protein
MADGAMSSAAESAVLRISADNIGDFMMAFPIRRFCTFVDKS